MRGEIEEIYCVVRIEHLTLKLVRKVRIFCQLGKISTEPRSYGVVSFGLMVTRTNYHSD